MTADPRALGAALDAQTSVLEAMVDASQRQIAAILAYRADMQRSDELANARTDLSRLTAALGTTTDAVRGAAHAITPGAGPTEAARALPVRERQAIEEKLSIVRSLAQALSELQGITQFHAQRGLQIVKAWRTLVDPRTGAGTYSRPAPGRRVVRNTDVESRVLEVDV